jgi:ADP-heptose:LPS heptosyltransferase
LLFGSERASFGFHYHRPSQAESQLVVMIETQAPKRPAHVPHGRLMLCNFGRLGDTILRNSILDAALRTYATVDYICGPDNVELVRNDFRLSEVTVFHKSLSGWAGLLKTALRRRYEGYIELKDHCSLTSLTIARLFRSRVKTGCNSDYLRPFHRDARGACAPNRHRTETMRAIGELAGLEPGEYKPSLVLPADSINWFKRNYGRERPFIFLNISATGADRMWPVERWARYVQGCGLGKESILINGVPKDRQLVDELCAKLPGALAFQPRQFMDVAAAVDGARLVLTVDTGVVHVCSALNKPVVALFTGSDGGGTYKPLSNQRLVIEARGTMAGLDPEEAIAQTRRQASRWLEAIS